tara:strand:+ start:19049 stop:19882 length:834 start_codon:yes stop_codon:yes gene_type:complete
MAGKVRNKKFDPMSGLLLKEQDRKRYEGWLADRKANKPYSSFVRVGSMMSFGRKHRFWCDKQQRIVELLSDTELRAYKYLIWQPNVVAIEEQYALNPAVTFEIAKSEKIVHPYNYKQHVHHVMTTDLLATTIDEDGVCSKHAYSVKPYFNEKNNSRTGQKLRLETLYWHKYNVPYSVLTNSYISKEWFLTLSFCELHYDQNIELDRLSDFSQQLLSIYQRDPWAPLRELLKRAASLLQTQYAVVECLFKNAVLRGYLPLSHDVRVRLNEALPVEGFQ